MVVNPVGAVPIADGGVPSTITVRCAVGVTGGQLIYFSGTSNAVSSGADSYASTDIVVGGLASGALFNGIVVTNGLTASGTNNYVAIGTKGSYIITSAGTILGGQAVIPNGADAVVAATLAAGGTGSYVPIGRAWTPAGSEGYSVIQFA